MRRVPVVPVLALCAAAAGPLHAHSGPGAHSARKSRPVAQGAETPTAARVVPPAGHRAGGGGTPPPASGQGEMRFRVLYGSERLPEAARAVLPQAHGGFAVDRRAGRGETYFALPGAGILQIASDLQSIRALPTPEALRDVNLHNATLWRAPDGAPYLSFPANDEGKVFTTTLEGELVHTLGAPSGESDLGHPTVNEYFRVGGRFTPTDVDVLRGWLYVTTGYSDLDYVLTARVEADAPLDIEWNDLAFGGRGTGPGRLGTGHGVTVVGERIEVADRPHAEVDRFTRYGHYLSTLALPAGSFPCDIDYEDGYSVVGALHGPDRTRGAPIYVLQGDRVVSAVHPKDELGLEGFQHVHNAVLRRIGERFYIIAQAWNPGDFAVLEQVKD